MTVRELVDKFLDIRCKHLSGESLDERRQILGKLCACLGDREIMDCKPIDMLQFFESQTTWKRRTTRHGRVQRILACFNWAVRIGLIERNPFADSRGGNPYADFIGGYDVEVGYPSISDEDFNTLLASCRRVRLKRVLLFLRYTGCRPVELRRMIWSHVHADESMVVQAEHKTAKTVGRPRIIQITDEVRGVLDAIRREQGDCDDTAFVFVNERGRPWSRQCLNSSVKRAVLKAGFTQRITPYGIGRVAFIERAILANVNLKAIAELVGHSGTERINTYARRLGQYGQQLRVFASQIISAPLVRRTRWI